MHDGAPDGAVLARAEYVIALFVPCLAPVDKPLELLTRAYGGPIVDDFVRVARGAGLPGGARPAPDRRCRDR